jgi:hypothetical protein
MPLPISRNQGGCCFYCDSQSTPQRRPGSNQPIFELQMRVGPLGAITAGSGGSTRVAKDTDLEDRGEMKPNRYQ